MARLIDDKATSVFQRHCSHLASFVSAALNPTISVCFLLVAACTVERGLSSESNSVSGPLTPSTWLSINFHMNPSDSLVWVLTDISPLLLATVWANCLLLFNHRKGLLSLLKTLCKLWIRSPLRFCWPESEHEQSNKDEAQNNQHAQNHWVDF